MLVWKYTRSLGKCNIPTEDHEQDEQRDNDDSNMSARKFHSEPPRAKYTTNQKTCQMRRRKNLTGPIFMRRALVRRFRASSAR